MLCRSPASLQFLRAKSIAVLCFVVLTSAAQACLWDWDTLQMERRKFPGALELITGNFVRHSPAYYQWRIQDRTKRMRSPAEDPELADDLSVAYSKLGRHAAAIELLGQVLEKHPDRYETLSNLGTIHMLAGDLSTGKDYIDRAIVVNPDAHFGREKYQSLLAEYFLTARESPIPAGAGFTMIGRTKGETLGFARFITKKRLLSDEATNELRPALKGVLGMMHFANYDSPLLLEALGDLLLASSPSQDDDALQLAARAYYRAAQQTNDPANKREFTRAARNCVAGHSDYIGLSYEPDVNGKIPRGEDLDKLAAELDRELADARTYVASIAADEQLWIAQGINVDQAFAAKYYDSLDGTIEDAKRQLASEWSDERGNPYEERVRKAWLFLGALSVGICAIVYAFRRYRARRNPI